MSQKKDNLFARPRKNLVDFTFDESVAQVFPDMIRRSVPGYENLIALLGVFAGRYAQENTCIYDLGCSLGAATLSLRRHIESSGCRIIAVDNARAMVDRCRQNIKADPSLTPVELVCADIRDVIIENASMVTLNLTLQFLAPADRLPMLKTIYSGLVGNGVLVLSEKIEFQEHEKQSLFADLHHDFKRANGYSDLEISQKRQAIENVLVPDTVEQHISRIHSAGFSKVYQWFQCFNFVSYIAFK